MTAVTLPTRSRPWLAPLAGALAYPLFLRSAYGSMRMWTEASSGTERFAAMLMVVASLLAGYAVPLIAAFSASRIARHQAGTAAAIHAYRFAHLVFAVPPLFTLMGVLTAVLGIGDLDFLMWLALWLGLGLYLALPAGMDGGRAARPPTTRAALVHGSLALGVLLLFLVAHLINHSLALWSPHLHERAMHHLESFYRAPVFEPLLVLGMLLLVATGLRLAWKHTAIQGDGYRRLQTLTGFYLAAFILSHLTAILVLARWQGGVNTGTWTYESNAPDGFLGNAWNPRLLFHYSLVVWVVATHAGLGLRGVLKAHGIGRAADRAAYGMSVLGAVAALAITLALFGVHLDVP